MPTQEGNSPINFGVVKTARPYIFPEKTAAIISKNTRPLNTAIFFKAEVIVKSFKDLVFALTTVEASFKSFKDYVFAEKQVFSNIRNFKAIIYALSVVWPGIKSGLIPRLGVSIPFSTIVNFKSKVRSLSYKGQGEGISKRPTQGQLYPRGVK